MSFDEGEQSSDATAPPRYTSQPPLYTWLQWPVFAIVGRGVLGLALLKNALLFSIYLFVWLIRQVSGNERTASTATLATFLLPRSLGGAARPDALGPADGGLAGGVLDAAADGPGPRCADAPFGVCVAAGLLSKYNFVFFLAGLLAAALSVGRFGGGFGRGISSSDSGSLLWRRRTSSGWRSPEGDDLQAGRPGSGAALPARILRARNQSTHRREHRVRRAVAIISAIFFAAPARRAGYPHGRPERPWPRTMAVSLPLAAIAIESQTTIVKAHWLMPALALASPPRSRSRAAGAGEPARLRGRRRPRRRRRPLHHGRPVCAAVLGRPVSWHPGAVRADRRQIRGPGSRAASSLRPVDRGKLETAVSRLALHLRRPRGLPDAHRRALGLRVGPDLGKGDRGRRSRAQRPDLRRRPARLQPDRGLSPASGRALPVHGRRSARARFRRRPARGAPDAPRNVPRPLPGERWRATRPREAKRSRSTSSSSRLLRGAREPGSGSAAASSARRSSPRDPRRDGRAGRTSTFPQGAAGARPASR